jgi:aspartate kinase
MIIQKFGGTSMGSTASILNQVRPIVQRAVAAGDSPIVVVSAMSGITSILLGAADAAARQQPAQGDVRAEIRRRHREVIDRPEVAAEEREKFLYILEGDLQQLHNLLAALTIIGDLPIRPQDAIIALGEKLSAHLLTAVLRSAGTPAEYIDTLHIVPSTLPYDSDCYWDDIEVLFRNRLAQVAPGHVAVVPGYFGDTAHGIIKSVGRGYSDYSASLIGSAVRASEVQIWTDVDGVLSANPRVAERAFILDRISYDEMAELAHFGAKVLHPFSVRPAVNSGIPMRILNTFNPSCPGTLIEVSQTVSDLPFKSITYKKDVTVVRITTPRMLLSHGFLGQVGAILARHHISIDLIATSEVSISFTIDEGSHLSPALQAELSKLGELSVTPAQSIISLVGSELGSTADLLERTFRTLHQKGAAVKLISFGDLRINLSLIVESATCDDCVRALHREFFEGV